MCKLTNNKQLTDNRQHRIGSHEEQPLLFSLVHLILCLRDNKTANAPGRRRCVAHLRLFAIGVLAQATAGVLALLVTRWSFRSLPGTPTPGSQLSWVWGAWWYLSASATRSLAAACPFSS